MGLPAIGLGLSALGTLGSMISGVSSGRAAASTAKAVAKAELEEARQRTLREAEKKHEEARRLLGLQQLAAASAGISPSVGSPLDVQLETVRLARQELEDIFLAGQQTERRIRLARTGRLQEARALQLGSVFSGLGKLGTLATQIPRGRTKP